MPRSGRAILYGSAVVAAAVVVLMVTTRRTPDAGLDVVRDSWFVSDLAYAQTPPAARPAYAAALVTRADRMHPLAMHYQRRFITGTGTIPLPVDVRIELSRDAVGRMPAGGVASVGRTAEGVQTDSTWVGVADLLPLRRVAEQRPYRNYERIRIEQTFDGLHVTGEMRAWKAGALSARRTFDRRLPASFGPYVSDALAPLYYRTLSLNRAWTGSLSALGWAVRDDDVFVSLDMRVDGEDTVRVPAGEFACWRVEMRYGNRRAWYWVRKADGVGVRTLDSTEVGTRGVRESVLLEP